MSLCPSLSAFRFSADAQLDLGLLNLHDDSDGDDHAHYGAAAGEAGAPDDNDFGGFDAGAQDFGGGFDDDSEGGGGGGGGADEGGEVDFFADQFAPVASGSGSGGGAGGFGFGAVEAFDPRRAADERDLVMAMDGGGDDGLLFEHFDAKLGRNWAGPEHWKMRRGVAAGKQGALLSLSLLSLSVSRASCSLTCASLAADDGAAPAPRVKKDKVAFSLDFSGEPPVPIKELFAAAAPKSSITTAATKSSSSAAGRARKSSPTSADDDFTLPDDFHFNSQNLLRLFLKPKTTVRLSPARSSARSSTSLTRSVPSLPSSPRAQLKMRRRGGVQPQLGLDGAEGDVQFWAQAGAGGAGGPGGEDGYGGGMDTIDFPGDFGGGASSSRALSVPVTASAMAELIRRLGMMTHRRRRRRQRRLPSSVRHPVARRGHARRSERRWARRRRRRRRDGRPARGDARPAAARPARDGQLRQAGKARRRQKAQGLDLEGARGGRHPRQAGALALSLL